jgi:hypothetical protein
VLTSLAPLPAIARRVHINVSFFVAMLSPRLRPIADLIAELLVALVALLMVIWGAKLVDATWYDTIADRGVGRRHLSADPARRRHFAALHNRACRRTDDGRQMTADRRLINKKVQQLSSVLRTKIV